jgi:hypothetical protein
MAVDVDITGKLKTARGYTWRGVISQDALYVQPSVTMNFHELTIGMCMDRDLQHKDDSVIRSRLNLSCDYSTMFNNFVASIGMIGYIYQDSPAQIFDDTADLYFQLACSLPVVVSLTIYRDIARIDNFYYSGKIAYSLPLNEKGTELGINVSASAGSRDYNQYMMSKFLPEQNISEIDDGLVDFSTGLQLSVPADKNLTFVSELRYIRLMDTIRDAVKKAGKDSDTLVYSIMLEYSFR